MPHHRSLADESAPESMEPPGQILTKVSDVTKIVMVGAAARLFHGPLTRHYQIPCRGGW